MSYSVLSVRIKSYSGPYFPAFGQNTEAYGVSLRIKSECGEMRTRITPNEETFLRSVIFLESFLESLKSDICKRA